MSPSIHTISLRLVHSRYVLFRKVGSEPRYRRRRPALVENSV